ncbi:MAG: AsmA family protein [Bacteroidia bacterium]|nr:AsmA family protein [Bacteroidia bacterium]
MKKFLKISGIIILLLLIILVSAPFLFKGKIIEMAKKEANANLNATINFSDDIGISLFKSFPKLTLTVNNLSIIGKDTFKGDTLVYLPSLTVSLNVMSVVKGETMEINKISLEKPLVNLLVLENGQANWDIALPDSSVADTTPSKFKMALERLSITGGNVIYDDKSLGFYTSLQGMNHELKGDFTLDRFLMETSTQADALTLGYGGVNYLTDIKTDIKANLDMDIESMKFIFKDNAIKLNDLIIGGEGFVDMNEEDMDFDLVFKTAKADFKTFLSIVPGMYANSFDKLKAGGKLDLSGYFKGKMTDDKMPGFGVKLDIDNGYFRYPDLPKSLEKVFVNLSIDNPSGYMDNTLVNLSRFDANVAGEPINAQLKVKTPISNPYIVGALRGNINLNEFRSLIPLDKTVEINGIIKSDVAFKGYVSAIEQQDLDKFEASGTIKAEKFHYKDPESLPMGTNLDASMSFNPQTISLDNLKGNAGMSDFDLSGRIDNLFGYMLKDELLKGQFTLNSNYFNANEFLSDDKVVEEPTAADSVQLQAFEVPGNIDFEFNSRINTLIYDNLKMSNLGGKIIARQKQLFFEKVGVELLGGSMGLNGVYDSKNPKYPFSNIDFNINSLDIIQTFNNFDIVKQLMPVAQYTQGLFNAKISLANNFNQDLSVSYPTVTGFLQMGIADAAVKNLPILNILADKLKLDKLKNLNLKNLNFKLAIANGKVMLDSLIVPLWTGAKAKISGFTALDQSIQYVAKLSIPRKDFGEANTALNNLTSQAKSKGLNITLSDIVDVDVLIGGFFNKPDVKVSLHDAKNSLLNSAKDQIKEQADKQIQAAKDEAKRRAEIAKQKSLDSLNKIKQAGIDKAAAEKKALEDKLAEEKRKAEEQAKAAANKAAEEAKKKAEEEKKKALDKLKGGLIKK